jgi:hypothetical protein
VTSRRNVQKCKDIMGVHLVDISLIGICLALSLLMQRWASTSVGSSEFTFLHHVSVVALLVFISGGFIESGNRLGNSIGQMKKAEVAYLLAGAALSATSSILLVRLMQGRAGDGAI